MICPHCGEKIEDGSNVCPRCYTRLTGASGAEFTGRKRSKKRGNPAPTIIAVGIILILLVVIALIVRSMFLPATRTAAATPTPVVLAQPTAEPNFAVFGRTAVPEDYNTATPDIAVTATPAPEPEGTPEAEPQEASYKTLRKGDQGVEVVMLQEALASLGYLTTASDGIFGTGTATAVRAFQSDNSLDADGIAGRQTQALLFAMTNITPIPDITPAPGDILDLPG